MGTHIGPTPHRVEASGSLFIDVLCINCKVWYRSCVSMMRGKRFDPTLTNCSTSRTNGGCHSVASDFKMSVQLF